MSEPQLPLSDPAAPAGGGPWRWAPLLLVAIAWIAHGSVRNHGWVLDDVHLVRDNPLVARGPAAIREIVAGGASGAVEGVEHGSHGPVALASFALEAPLWRRTDGTLKAAGFHLTNLLLHGLCVLLFFRFLLAVAPGRPLLALGAAVVFAAHPIHTGTISALMGRAAILAALFGLLAALAWGRFGGRRLAWLPVAALLWMLAIFAHPVALGLPLVLWLLDVRAGATRDPRPVARLGVLAFAVPLAVFLLAGGGTFTAAGDLPAQGPGSRLLLGCEGLVRMMLSLVLPTGLRGDHSDEAVPGLGYEADALTYGALAFVLVLTLAVLLHARRRGLGGGATLWLATLALALPAALAMPAGATLELRWAYVVALPLLACVGLLAEGLLRAGGGSPGFVRARLAMVGGLVVVCLIGLSHREAEAWKDDVAFHAQLLERNPSHVRAMTRHAESLRRTATRFRDESTQLRADDPERAFLLQQSRTALEGANRWSMRAVRHEQGRHSAEAWRTRGFVLLAANRSASALRALEQARDLDPALKQTPEALRATYGPARLTLVADMYAAIGRAREALGDRERAADAYGIATKLAPHRVDLTYRAGMALCRVNRYDEGLTLLLDAYQRAADPGLRDEIDAAIQASRKSARQIARKLLAEGHAAKVDGKMRKAISLYEQALEVNPASVDAWSHAAWLRGHWFGNYEQAEGYLKKAEGLLRKGEIPPEDPRWERIRGYRTMLAQQRAEEDAEAEGK
ncbi:MAG: tetratricopeptide repeat protein [Planctomycetota bacterium]|nr:tetratricopeptide repeat protein [Planctomycetota bacterium]